MHKRNSIWIGLAVCLAGMASTFVLEPTFFASRDDARGRLVADRGTITTSDNDLAYVSLEVVDAQGRLVPQDRYPVSVTVTGDGILAGCGTGYHKDVRSFGNPDNMQTWRGRAMAIVRSNQTPGTITVKTHSSQFGDAMLEITVRETSAEK